MAKANKPVPQKVFRFFTKTKSFYGGTIFRPKSGDSKPDYLDLPVPVPPSHHFAPLGELKTLPDGTTQLTNSDEMSELYEDLIDHEIEIGLTDHVQAALFFGEFHKELLEENVDDVKKAAGMLKKRIDAMNKTESKQQVLDIG